MSTLCYRAATNKSEMPTLGFQTCGLAVGGLLVWVQPGQMGDRLHYACVELDGGFEVMGVRHSVL